MSLQDSLSQFAESHLHLAIGGVRESDRFARELADDATLKGGIVRRIDGSRTADDDKLFQAFATAFEFPEYFGENWDALDECINDLAWLPARYYVALFAEAGKVLRDGKRDFGTLVNILASTAANWASTDRGNAYPVAEPRPFHVVLHTERYSMALVLRLLESAGPVSFDTTYI